MPEGCPGKADNIKVITEITAFLCVNFFGMAFGCGLNRIEAKKYRWNFGTISDTTEALTSLYQTKP